VGDPQHCYHVVVIFYDLIILSALIRHVNKDCDCKHILYMERDYSRLNITSVNPSVGISGW